MKQIVLSLIRIYQLSNPLRIAFSRAILGINYNCRFSPTCSDYMYSSIKKYGIVQGSMHGIKRIARCHPFSKRFGYDPVR